MLRVLRDGLGWLDMEVRSLAFLEGSNVLAASTEVVHGRSGRRRVVK
jgi:hypothetical protein